MRLVVLFIFVSVSVGDINKIARINQLKHLAEEAYRNGEFETAISSFRMLTDSLGVNEDPVLLNLANAYFKQNDTTNAAQYYSRVLSSDDDQLRSLAYQQMGIINKQQNKLNEALSDFKASLKSNPENEDSRYNYELLKKIMDEQEQQQQNENNDIKPSEYAKQLKAQADKLVRQNLFGQAMSIMQKGLQEDETVAAYNSFISKLNDVVESKE
ncbi:MAG: tetratricopeptide repeat protein [Cyclobacteriaceae bacterium]|nr:tetratricopeptide repeat protein [Cyclobacteriaceae bacterium]MCK5366962.1 tetratricopeptide repeat protein [Cyclobacteriaceae bacterium]